MDFHKNLPVTILCSVLISLGYAQSNDSIPQKDIVEVFTKAIKLERKQKERESRKVMFSLIPVAPSSSGGKQVFVSSLRAAFYLGPLATTNLSNVTLIPFFDFRGSGGIYMRSNLWTHENKWNILGELRVAQNFLYTYGLGANTQEDAQSTIKYDQFRVYGVFHRRILQDKDFFIGAGIYFDQFSSIEEQDSGTEDSAFKEYGIGTSGKSVSSGLTVNLLRDNRSNSINPTEGFYTALVLRAQGKEVGSDNTWSSLYLDARKYFSFSEKRHSVLAFWFLYWGTYGEIPYLNLTGTAMDFDTRTGRGYSLGRYRGEQMLYGETEYRFDISANGLWGGVVFANLQSYTELESERFEYIKVGAGAGVRLKFDKRSATNVTLDFGFGKDSFTVRLNLGEVF